MKIGDKVIFHKGANYPMSRYIKEGDRGEIIEVAPRQYRVHMEKDGRVVWAPPHRIVLESEYSPIKKVQCSQCFHWKFPENIDKPSGLCYECYEEEDDMEDWLWADWRQRCTL